MPWKECHVMDERMRFVARLLEGDTMSAVCEGLRDISRKTGYGDLRALQGCRGAGPDGRSRRPHHHANRLPQAVEALIVRLKKEYPTWGAPKLRERLRQRWPDVACPGDQHGPRRPGPSRPGAASPARAPRPAWPARP